MRLDLGWIEAHVQCHKRFVVKSLNPAESFYPERVWKSVGDRGESQLFPASERIGLARFSRVDFTFIC